ncbi:hypothetical protein BLA29_010606 [Euroglyphus maynei]|uniref:Uncharacterized protein n=1 Tax=Euroglyphus maynei TaxID=6958 RepID=A0A1Y3BCD2_EURMA|nr:hypothetical protein BLA29_010606 [Euroglyphus maynei]
MLLLVSQESGDTSSNGQSTTDTATTATVTATTSTPRIISRSARVTRSSAKSSDVQVIYDDSKSMLTSGNSDISATSEPPSQISFENETINYEEQLQKQKDLEACFGFKDEDDEDEIILSMPAVHGQ